MSGICILGGGPAGTAAALGALKLGGPAQLIERSKFPRHKVCGEFLSPGIAPVLDQLGVWKQFQAERPALVRRMEIHIGRATKASLLPEPAFGLSRYTFDNLLWQMALSAGAAVLPNGNPDVIATGRNGHGMRRGRRLFGFKAHFSGPADDAVELYFSGKTYVGINAVEDGITNVCGLAPEGDLKCVNFDIDTFIRRDTALKRRLEPLTRKWDWIFTGPLHFKQNFEPSTTVYQAGDALSFVDPFTGSGLLCALITGKLAAEAAVRRDPVSTYLNRCSAAIQKPFWFSTALRRIASTKAAGPLLHGVPAALLFHYTRPDRYAER